MDKNQILRGIWFIFLSYKVMTDYTREEIGSMSIEDIASKASSIEEAQWMLKQYMWPLIEQMMQWEMESHLGYKKHDISWNNSWNSRNGSYKKKILTSSWHTEIEVPRDRDGSFNPKVIPKHSTRTSEMETKIINMYGLWLTTADIKKHILDIYGANISKDMVSSITDKVIPLVREWQQKPLEAFYPIIYLDAVHFKIRDNHKIENKWVYVVLGINQQGRKEVLWLYVGENESASFWQSVVNDISNRWVQDICIACIDGLAGFGKAIKVIYPDIEVQRCVIHQIRYSMTYVNSEDSKIFMSDLKAIYQAKNLESAAENLGKLEEKWWEKYPISVRSWKNNWEELSSYFVYSHHLRRIIYTTNTVESYNRQLRKVTKNRSVFPTVTSLEKLLYLATKNIEEKWSQPIHHWGQILWQFDAFFPNKVEKYLKK